MNNSPYQKIGHSRFQRGSILQIIPLRHGVELILSSGVSLHLHRLSPTDFDPAKLANQIEMGTDVPSVYVTEHPCPDFRSNFLSPAAIQAIMAASKRAAARYYPELSPLPAEPPIESLSGRSSEFPPNPDSSGEGRGGRSR